jgi:hypothetical protein
MRVDFKAGGTLTAEAEHIRGEAEHPHSDAELAGKFLSLTAPSWGDAAEPALAALRTIHLVPDIAALMARLRPVSAS